MQLYIRIRSKESFFFKKGYFAFRQPIKRMYCYEYVVRNHLSY